MVGKHAKAVKVAAKKADKAAKVTEKERKEVEAEVAKDKLAELENDESFIQQQEQQGRIRRQSDMGAGSRGNNLDDSEEEFVGLMDPNFGGNTSETDAEPDAELALPTKKQGTAAAAAPMVGFHHLGCRFNKTHCHIQTNTKGKKKARPKLQDQVATKRNKRKDLKAEMGRKK